ncbi:alpha/beta hydrolase [Actinomycetaceae bacterium L2_0104]
MSTVVFLAGLGQPPEVWRPVIEKLPDGLEGLALPIALGPAFSLVESAQKLRDQLEAEGIARAHVCGLSLGAMLGLQFAADFADRTDRLILSGGQVHPNPVAMRAQNAVMRILPKRLVASPAASKEEVLAALRAIQHMDLREEMARVRAETLVLCGRRDLANRRAARDLAAGINGARLEIVAGVGHPWNETHPELFANKIAEFLV